MKYFLIGVIFFITGCYDSPTNNYKYTIWIDGGGYYTNSYEIKDRVIYFTSSKGYKITSNTFRIVER